MSTWATCLSKTLFMANCIDMALPCEENMHTICYRYLLEVANKCICCHILRVCQQNTAKIVFIFMPCELKKQAHYRNK